jgi:nicotinamidase/pyrazinamidase
MYPQLLIFALLALYASSEIVISRPLESMIQIPKVGIISVDTQNTFSNDIGELFVPGAHKIFQNISILMEFLEKIRANHIKVVSQDWHSLNHISIARAERLPFTQFEYNLPLKNGTVITMTQIAWPSHGIAGTYGAEFDDRFNSTGFKVFKKGTNSIIDSYSAFGDELGGLVEDTGLHTYFQEKNVNTVIVFGLATDYCVQYTIKDAFRLGYKVILFLPGSAGITPEGVNSTIELVENNGGLVIRNMMELYKIPIEIYKKNEMYENNFFKQNNYVIQK